MLAVAAEGERTATLFDESIVSSAKEKVADLLVQAIAVLPGLVLAVIVLLLTRSFAKLVRRATTKIANKALNSLSLQTLLVQTGYVAAWATGILLACILAFPNVGVADLIALLGLGSVAIGFAFQDIFKNFLSGVLLLLQEPFSLRDEIVVEGFEGTVEEIALRATSIRTYTGEIVVVPNSVVFTSPVRVKTAKPQRRTDLAIGVDYNTPLQMAVDTLLAAVNSVEEVRSMPSAEVDIVEFGDSSINMLVRYWTVPQQKSVRRVQTQVVLALKQACDAADISIPYPIRTVYHFDQDRYADSSRLGTPDAN